MNMLSTQPADTAVSHSRTSVSMTTSVPFSAPRSLLNSVLAYGLAAVLLAGLMALPAHAQSEGGDELRAQIEEAFGQGEQARQQGDFDTAYAQWEEAHRLAGEADQSRVQEQIGERLVQLARTQGNNAIEEERNEDVVYHFEKGIEFAPDEAYFYYGKGLGYLRLEDEENGIEMMLEAISVGEETGDQRTVGMTTERIRQEYISRASQALSNDNPGDAIDALDTLEEYVDPNANAFFYRGMALFELGDYEDAIAAAQEGLNLHDGGRSSAAKFHFVIAESQFNLGNTEEACETFEDAAFGDYSSRSQHYLENECD